MHALHIKYFMHRYVRCIFYVKGYTVADPPWSGYSLQRCWSSSLTGCCWRTLSSSSPDQHVTHPDEEEWKEGWKDRTDEERGWGDAIRRRQIVIPLKSRLCLGMTKTFFPSRMDLKGLKGMSVYIIIHKHRLFHLLHRASSFQSVIVFPDAKSLCLPFTIRPLIIPDQTEAAGSSILILPLRNDTADPISLSEPTIGAHPSDVLTNQISPPREQIRAYVGKVIQLWIY